MIDVFPIRVGMERYTTIQTIVLRDCSPPFQLVRLGSRESKCLTFSLTLRIPAIYYVHARVRKVKILDMKGELKWDEEISYDSVGQKITVAGSSWYMIFEQVRNPKLVSTLIRCLSMYEVLMILGSIGAIISAICGLLLLSLR